MVSVVSSIAVGSAYAASIMIMNNINRSQHDIVDTVIIYFYRIHTEINTKLLIEIIDIGQLATELVNVEQGCGDVPQVKGYCSIILSTHIEVISSF